MGISHCAKCGKIVPPVMLTQSRFCVDCENARAVLALDINNQGLFGAHKETTMYAKFSTFANNNWKTTLALVVVAMLVVGFFIRLGLAFHNPVNYGVIALPNYLHAVLICGDGDGKERVVSLKEATSPSDKYGVWTVNAGHQDDPEVEELRRVAQWVCGYERRNVSWFKRVLGIGTHLHLVSKDNLSFTGMLSDTEGPLVTDPEALKTHLDECDHEFITLTE